MGNSVDRVDILHIAPQPEGRNVSVCAVTDKVQDEFRKVCPQIHLDTVKPSDGMPIEQDLQKFAGLIVSGSLHSTYEENLAWMPALEELIQSSHDRQLATLGSCFGHQAIAQALGGKVEQGNQGIKLGYFPVELTQAGVSDKLYENVDRNFMGTSWHQDVVTRLPGSAFELAIAEQYGTQSFGIGDHIRTTQFHPEFSDDVLQKILTDSPPKPPPHCPAEAKSSVNRSGSTILQNFAKYFILRK